MAYAEPVLRPPRAACARVPEAQWRDGGWRGSAGAVALSKPVTKYLSNGATNPIHARYYCGGNNLPKVRIRAHPPPAAPPFAASKPGSFGAGSTLQTHNAAKLNNAGSVVLNPDSAIPRLLSVCTGRAKVQTKNPVRRSDGARSRESSADRSTLRS